MNCISREMFLLCIVQEPVTTFIPVMHVCDCSVRFVEMRMRIFVISFPEPSLPLFSGAGYIPAPLDKGNEGSGN